MKLALMPMSELIRRMIVEPTDPAYAAEIDRRMPNHEGALDAAYGNTSGLSGVSAAGARVEMERVIDERPCEPLTDEDCDWGGQDSLANVPKRSDWSEYAPGYEQRRQAVERALQEGVITKDQARDWLLHGRAP